MTKQDTVVLLDLMDKIKRLNAEIASLKAERERLFSAAKQSILKKRNMQASN
ncbi:hypothetical protein [Mucilaginibacter agri]|uniref:Uncharacterized protein n=1 Tax=Mucilaginibacter agri TaxID=2695265 RepID=A0A965ZEK2_9SPHI|nr:hypothetical protein [Mucilaginibacter agri]NCD68326.1 hypothetical protein [Mucilaginibacter agri]